MQWSPVIDLGNASSYSNAHWVCRGPQKQTRVQEGQCFQIASARDASKKGPGAGSLKIKKIKKKKK